MYLLDTNAVIDYLEAGLPVVGMQFIGKIVDDNSNVSVITKMETLGYAFKSINEQNIMETFISGSNVLIINDEIVDQVISLRKTKRIKLPDAIIAATALVYRLTLITRNTRDFNHIQNLHVIDPYGPLKRI